MRGAADIQLEMGTAWRNKSWRFQTAHATPHHAGHIMVPGEALRSGPRLTAAAARISAVHLSSANNSVTVACALPVSALRETRLLLCALARTPGRTGAALTTTPSYKQPPLYAD